MRRPHGDPQRIPWVLVVLFLAAGCPGGDRHGPGEAAEADAGGIFRNRVVQVWGPGELAADDFPIAEGETAIVLVGDIMPWNAARKHLERHGARYPFLATAPLLQTTDLTVGNLECPIAVEADTIDSRYPYKVPPWTLEGLRWAGFDAVNLANNHIHDTGREGMLETFHNLREAGMPFFGAGRNLREAETPLVLTAGGVRVALCGFVAPETRVHEYRNLRGHSVLPRRYARAVRRRMLAERRAPGAAAAFDEEDVVRVVRRARRRADFVILFMHWGVRYHRPPTAFQQCVARAAVDAGADLVVGSHAHFWQPLELYEGTPVVYGLGNFAFGSGNRRADEGLLVRAVLHGAELDRIELFPLYIKNRDRRVRYQSKVMRGASAENLLRRLRAWSRQRFADFEIEDGRGVLRLRSEQDRPAASEAGGARTAR